MSSSSTIKLFGNPSVVGAGGCSLAGVPKKAFVVAAIVARETRAGWSKADVGQLLWPRLDASQRANNLRQLLFRIRQFERDNDIALFETGDGAIGLAPEIHCDLILFQQTLNPRIAPKLGDLLALYGGRLLAGVKGGQDTLDRWLTDQRLQLEDQFVDMALEAVEVEPVETKEEWYRAIVELAPEAIAPRKALMRHLIVEGHTKDARRAYREIQQIGGPGAIAAPPELVMEIARAQPGLSAVTVPLGQLGRDQAGVPHVALLTPRGAVAGELGQHLAETMVDDVTIALTRLRSVSVLAPHSARKVANGEDPRGIALARADFVLRTKIVGLGKGDLESPKLVLMLERASSGDILWAEKLALDPAQGHLSFAAIANGIALTLVDQMERATLRAFQVPVEAGAYGHYLMGQKAIESLDLASTRRARNSFKSALALAPYFAPAHTGIAQSLIYEWVMRGQGDQDLIVRAREAAERARDIDPLYGSAYQMLGRASLFEGDFTTSLEHFARAEALNPHHADLLCDMADTLMHNSHAEHANDKIELALRLNPLAPDAYWWASAGIKFFVGEYDRALSHLAKIKNSEPVLRLTAACAAMAGQQDLARLSRNRFMAIDPGFKLDDWIGVLPVRDPAHRRQYKQALQKAGFK